MTNPYKPYLNTFFETITDFKHTASRLNKVLLNDVKKYTAEGARYFSGTALIIGDWTGPTDKGWKINFPTGVQKSTLKENYANEIKKVLSREFGLAFAQCYEALETLFKDFVNEKIQTDQNFRNSLPDKKHSTRESLKGGDTIFELIKKAGGERFKKYSHKNNNGFKFKETFTILSEVRHSIIHSQGKLKVSKIPSDKYYRMLFEHLFPFDKLSGETLYLTFDYKSFDKLLTYMAEFGYQMFKILNEEEKHDWKI